MNRLGKNANFIDNGCAKMSNITLIQEINDANTKMKLEYVQKVLQIFPKVNWDRTILAKQAWTTIIRQTYVLIPSTVAINAILQTISPHALSDRAGRLYSDIVTRGTGLFSWASQYPTCFTDGGVNIAVLPSDSKYNNGFPAIAYNVAPGVVQIPFAYDMPDTDKINYLLAANDTQCAIFQPVEATPDMLRTLNLLYDAAHNK